MNNNIENNSDIVGFDITVNDFINSDNESLLIYDVENFNIINLS